MHEQRFGFVHGEAVDDTVLLGIQTARIVSAKSG
jgi:hypothetical protein